MSINKPSRLTGILTYKKLSLILFTNVVCKKDTEELKVDTTNKKDVAKVTFTKNGEVFFQDSTKKLQKEVDVEIVETDEKRHLGLMFRESMAENQGMLFIFDREELQGFYMRNTLIPLDIIFVDAKKKIVKIHKNAKPLDETDLPSVKPSIYVVEVNGGFTDKFKIKEGDYIDWRRN